MPEARDPAALPPRREDEHARLLKTVDAPSELDSPRLNGFVAEAELAEWDADFHAPPLAVDRGGPVPDGVPGVVTTESAVADLVPLYACRVQAELVGVLVVVVSVHRHREPVRVPGSRVTASEPLADFPGRVPHAGSDVDRVRVVEHIDVCLFGRRVTFAGVYLGEVAA